MPRGINDYDTAILQRRLWTPAVLRPALWFDCSDLSAMSTTGNVITTLVDKSGNGRNAAAINSPTLVQSVQNGYSVGRVTQASEDRWSVNLDFLAGSGQNHTCVAAYKVTPTTDGFLYGAATGGAGSNSLHCGYSQRYGRSVSCNYWGNDVGALIPSWFREDAGNIYSIVWNTAGNREININGRQIVKAGGTSTIGTMSGGGRIFGVVTGVYSFPTADLYELFICLGLLSSSELYASEGYYAWKWNLPLAADHPYANRPPLIGD